MKGSAIPWLVLLRGEVFRELYERANPNSRWSLRDPSFVVFHPGSAGDVQMQPGSIFGKLLEEHGGGNCSAPAAAGVDNIGDVGPDAFFVFLVERQSPHFLARLLQRPFEELIHFVIVGEYASIYIPQLH